MDACPILDKYMMTNTTYYQIAASMHRVPYRFLRVLRLSTIVVLSLFTTVSLAKAQDVNGNLTVIANGFKTNTGHAIARLYLPGNEVTRKGQLEISAFIKNGQSSFVFTALPAGEYAVVVFHDANDNGTVDHNFVGLPVEALGFSNGFRVSLFSGMPDFEKLRFTHTNNAQTIQITVE